MRLFRTMIAAAAIAMISAGALAQSGPPAVQGYPTNVDLTNALLTNTARVPSTTQGTPATANLRWRGLSCATLWTAETGSPTQVISIQGFDAAINSWYTIKASATYAITDAPNQVRTVTVYPGVAVSSLATGNEAQSAVLPRVWRLNQVIGGTGTLTSKTGCNYID